MDQKTFYRNARAYDIAFGERDFDDECDFLEWCLKEHGKVRPKDLKNKSFLEMASGPSRHAIEFAKRNWRAIALDNSIDMLGYASELAQKENVKLETVSQDMTEFKLTKPVTLAATMMESIAHLTTNEMMISHLNSVADSLVPGGIYIIEATHPNGFFPEDEANVWIEKNGDMKVELTFGLPTDEYNYITQIWNVTTIMRIWNGNGKVYKTTSNFDLRWYLAQELKAIIELSGAFEKYWFYGNVYSTPPHPFDNSEESDSMIIVLRKKR
ncbi:class I SAM-dependent methyltransferase [Bacteroidota bacterium]